MAKRSLGMVLAEYLKKRKIFHRESYEFDYLGMLTLSVRLIEFIAG
jgi:hypothetical protein